MTDDADALLVFVRARLDDEQMMAKLALDHPGEYDHALRARRRTGTDDGVWSVGEHESDACRITGIGITIYDEGGHNEAQARFIAYHDPAHALHSVEAVRKILAEHAHVPVDGTVGCSICALIPREVTVAPDGWCQTVRLLGSIWSVHPDYRQEWAP